MLRRLVSAGSLRGAITFALGGAGFALANVLLAAAMAPTQFGLVSLVLALMQFGLSCGPLGLDVVAKRHRPRVTASLVWRAAGNAVGVAVLLAAGAAWLYGLDLTLSLLLLAGATLAAGNNIICGVYQSRSQLGWAFGLAQGQNYVLLLLACAALLFPPRSAAAVLTGVVAGYLGANLIGWLRAGRAQQDCAVLDARLIREEGLASVSIGLALQLLWQLERILIPRLTSVSDLATYAALAAIVAAPFRVTQFGVGFTLIDRLRRAPTAAAARAVLRHEIAVGALLVAASVAGVLIAAPVVFHHILHDKYVISPQLMAVTIAVGIVRVAEGFSTASVTALGTARSLARISAMGWVALLVALVAAGVLSRWGLTGIVGGTLLGWLTLWGSGCVLAFTAFRRRFG
jgi:O-antigen/teichoic acid export membrane protein